MATGTLKSSGNSITTQLLKISSVYDFPLAIYETGNEDTKGIRLFDANNQMIETSSNEFDECLNEFFSQIKEVFNKDAYIRTKKVEISSDMSYNESEEEEYARDE